MKCPRRTSCSAKPSPSSAPAAQLPLLQTEAIVSDACGEKETVPEGDTQPESDEVKPARKRAESTRRQKRDVPLPVMSRDICWLCATHGTRATFREELMCCGNAEEWELVYEDSISLDEKNRWVAEIHHIFGGIE